VKLYVQYIRIDRYSSRWRPHWQTCVESRPCLPQVQGEEKLLAQSPRSCYECMYMPVNISLFVQCPACCLSLAVWFHEVSWICFNTPRWPYYWFWLLFIPYGFLTWQESHAVVREYVLQSVQFLLQYWPSGSSKVNDFHVIWKAVCHFLLVLNSNLGYISSPFSR